MSTNIKLDIQYTMLCNAAVYSFILILLNFYNVYGAITRSNFDIKNTNRREEKNKGLCNGANSLHRRDFSLSNQCDV